MKSEYIKLSLRLIFITRIFLLQIFSLKSFLALLRVINVIKTISKHLFGHSKNAHMHLHLVSVVKLHHFSLETYLIANDPI